MQKLGITLVFVLLFYSSLTAQSDTNELVVPKGTRIQTDIAKSFPDTPPTPFEYDGKVEIPVLLGFTTAINAGNKVRVRITAADTDNGYRYAAELVAVTVDHNEFTIRTDRIPVDPSTMKEVAFTLLDDLKIAR
ncbi:MAG: hypothetical protein ROO76_12695 [Terriglobia bacterium]|jgi:hypothetical protein|nr:hypothetical protein [Terriglobia bacterium]